MKGIKYSKLFKQQNYIDGKWVNAENGKKAEIRNPFNNEVIANVPFCGKEETRTAIEVAHTAQKKWKQLSSQERSNYLKKLALLIDQHKEDLAILMTVEQGKPIVESRAEIDYANSFIKWFQEEAKRIYGDIIPAPKSGQHIMVIKEPVGVVAMITPWNFPSAMIARKLGPALAVGCTVVIKPALETPLSALALVALAEEAGFPPGVINIVTGDSSLIGQEMTSNSLVRKISFTGSTTVGRLLMQQSAPTLKRLSLELGGNAPFIVFEDAEIEAAVEGLMVAKFRNMGQTCVGANRIYVHEKIYEPFKQQLIKRVSQLKLGNGLDEKVDQGPLINQKAIDKVKKHIDDAVKKGGKIELGGKVSSLGNLFFEPTILSNANKQMLFTKEETFGPVVPLFSFKDEKEVIDLANDTEFGLVSYVYTQNLKRLWTLTEKIESGMVGINVGLVSTAVAPFGGIKQSGMGREGSKYGIDDYLDIKYVCVG